MPDQLGTELDLYRWTTIVITLGLDLAAPFIAEMGLLVPDTFQKGVQSITADLRAQDIDPELSPAYAQGLLAWCAKQYGTPVARKLYVWGCEVFDYGLAEDSGASIFLWTRILQHRGYVGQPLLVPPPFIIQVRNLLASGTPIKVEDTAPISEWDRSVYEWREYDLDTYTPMTTVALTIDDFRFRRAWATTRNAMRENTDFDSVKLWAFEVAKQMQLPLDRLGEPGSWPDLPVLL